jgi:hypothetical protein
MSDRRPKADRERTESTAEEPAVRQPNRSRAADHAQGDGPPVDFDERERSQRGRRKRAGPVEPPTPPPPPVPAQSPRDALPDAGAIADVPPTDPVYEDEG